MKRNLVKNKAVGVYTKSRCLSLASQFESPTAVMYLSFSMFGLFLLLRLCTVGL